jgi:tRNA(Ile)-lysidine synthase
MALLGLLAEIRQRFQIEIRAAHYDHGVRPGSAGEARSVARWCAASGLECRIGTGRPPPGPTQDVLRRLRYAFLHTEALRFRADRLVTAHHADDQAETVLFRLLRGTGLRGLGGIPARRGVIARPLLPFRRADIEEYLEEAAIPFLRDPSNSDTRWARVRVRREGIPALRRRWGADVTRKLVSLGDTAARADAALDRVAWRMLLAAGLDEDTLEPGPGQDGRREARSAARDRVWSVARPKLEGHHDELLARALRQLTERLGVQLSAGGTGAGVEFIKRGKSGAAVDLGGGLELRREFDIVTVGFPEPQHADRFVAIATPDDGSGMLLLGGRRYRACWSSSSLVGSGGEAVAVPESIVRYPLDLRAWRPGDRMRRTTGSRKLKRLFNDLRVPGRERGRVPLLAAGDTVLWAFGLAVAQGVRRIASGERHEAALSVRIEPVGALSDSRTETCSGASVRA